MFTEVYNVYNIWERKTTDGMKTIKIIKMRVNLYKFDYFLYFMMRGAFTYKYVLH